MSRYNKPYSNIGVRLFDPELFLQDEKHDGKTKIGEAQILYMLSRTQSMFRYKNLPETIPSRNLEMMLQINGNIFFTDKPGDFYVFTGGLGGEPDVYYEPTIYTVANPALNFSANLKIDTDGILIRSDAYGIGLLPMMQKYAALLVENEFTMRIADINSRVAFLMSASDDRTKASCELFLKRLVDGQLGIISDNSFLEDFAVHPVGDANVQHLTDLIEYQQYLKAAWFNELGLNANYNMKREAIAEAESQLNDDALLPLIDDMIEERKRGFKKVNEMYGLNIEVDLDSSWLKEQIQINGIEGSPLNASSALNNDEIQEGGATLADDLVDENDAEIETENIEIEETPNEPEEISNTEDVENNVETEDITDSDIKTDIQEIKEDIQEIKEELTQDEETE